MAGRRIRKGEKMLRITNLSKKYRGAESYSARSITFDVQDGEVCGLVGSNGAGKSTILKCITGILPFEEGEISVGGFDMEKESEKAKKLIGYVPDDHTVYDKLTGREYVNYMGSLYGATKERKKEVLETCAKIFHLEAALDVQIGNYSHGMKQKICIIGSLVHDPALWILDEPMVGLDPQTMAALCRMIREYADGGRSVLFSSHNLDVVKKVCDKIAFIRGGELACVLEKKDIAGDFDIDAYFMSLNGV